MIRKAFIILLLVVLAASAAMAAAWRAKSESVMAGARTMLEREITTAVGAEVSVGDIAIQGISSVVLDNIAIRDKQGDLAATAATISVSFNPLLLLMRSNPADAIHSVTVESPHLVLRQRQDLHWNVEDFTKEQKKESSPFGGNVEIRGGLLTIETQQQGSYQAENVHGTIGFAAKPSLAIDLAGKHNGANIQIEGSVNGKTRDALTIKADRLSLAEYQAVLPTHAVTIEKGIAKNLELTIVQEKEELHFSGEVSIEQLTGTADRVPLSEAAGFLTFDQDAVHVHQLDAKVWDQPVVASGKVSISSSVPVFDLSVKSSAFDPAVLPMVIPVRGISAFDILVAGTATDFRASGEISMDTGSYQQVAFTGAKARFRYENDLLQLFDAGLTVYDGRISASGVVELRNLYSDLRVTGRLLDGNRLGAAAGIDGVQGKVDFHMAIRGEAALSKLYAMGEVSVGSGQMVGIPFSNAYGGFHLRQGVLRLDYLNIGVNDGMASAKGYWDMGKDSLALEVEGHNLPLAPLTAVLPEPARASGAAVFTAKIKGSAANPQIALTITAEHGSILGQPFELLAGEAEISRDGVALRNFQVTNGPTLHKIDGTVQFTGKQELNLMVATRKARLENLLKPLPITERVTGNVDHDLTVTGTIGNPIAEGWLVLTDGSYHGFLVNSARGSYRYRDGVAEIQSVVINSLDNQVIVNGKVSSKGELALDISGNDIDIARLPVPYPYPVAGKAKILATLTGTLGVPQVTGQAVIPVLSANGQTFERVEAAVNLVGSRLDTPETTFFQGQSAFHLAGGIDFTTKEIYGSLRVEKAQASTVAALAKFDSSLAAGVLNGHFTWNGTLDNPGASFSGTATQSVVKGYNLGEVELEAELANHIITLEKLMVKQKDGLMAAKGQIDLQGDINLEAGARDIDAAFFAKIFDADFETHGKLSFTAQVTGKTANPHTAVSLEVANGSVATASFDNLYGLFTVERGKVQVNQLLLSKGEYKASAYGTIPMAAINPEGRRKATAADEMDLTFRLDNANLSILPIMTKAVSSASGDTKGEVKVTGNLFEPKMSGQITVKDGTVKFQDIAEPIQKVTIDIQFKDDTIHVRTFEGKLGAGTYRLAGSVAVRDMALHGYDMTLALDNVSLTHKYFKGPVNGQLALTEKKNMPHLAGQLLLANTTVSVPIVPVSSGMSAFDIGLDVDVVVGQKVRLYSPLLYDVWVEGKVQFDGSLQEPDVSGKIEAVRGTLNYLRTQFRIEEASVAFTQFRSFEPVMSLKALTRLEQTDVNLAVNGPVSAMDVQLTSDPPMSQQEIISLLTLRDKYFDRQASGKKDSGLGRDELVSMLDAGLKLQFLAEMEGMFRNSLGLDEFRLLRGSSSTELPFSSNEADPEQDHYRIEIGKYISDRLMLSYTTGVNDGGQSYGARYDVTKRISLTADVDEYDGLRVGVGMKFRF